MKPSDTLEQVNNTGQLTFENVFLVFMQNTSNIFE